MSVTEIVLLILGAVFFTVSFFIPDNRKEEERITEEEIKALIEKEMEAAKSRIDDMVEETVNYSVEKTERALERLSNEKIMAVDEYSETVLKKINDNHNEAVFLYDMLNDKDEKLKNTGEELKVSKTELELEKSELERKKKEEEEKQKKQEEIKRIEEETKKRLEEEQAAKERKLQEIKEKEEKPVFTPFVPERVEVVDGVAVTVSEAKKTKKTESVKNEIRSEEKPFKELKPSDVTLSFDLDNQGKKNSNEQIRRLHEEGKSNMQIAKELGLGVGEVKLVIDLFSSKKR